MEIKFKEGDSVNIPENCVAKIVYNVVVFEPEKTKFKRGDFIFAMGHVGESFLIYSGVNKDVVFQVFKDSGSVYFNGGTELDFIRLMTDSEKQILLDKLHENGKDWDEEKCDIVDWVWEPEIGQCIFGLSCVGVSSNTWRNFSYQRDALANKMIFKTSELAEAVFELIKNAKHF